MTLLPVTKLPRNSNLSLEIYACCRYNMFSIEMSEVEVGGLGLGDLKFL